MGMEAPQECAISIVRSGLGTWPKRRSASLSAGMAGMAAGGADGASGSGISEGMIVSWSR